MAYAKASGMRIDQPSARDVYVDNLYAKEDADLARLRARLLEAGRWGVNIGPLEGKILQVLIAMNRVKSIVEIGTLYGYSTVWMARALPADGHLYTIEKDPLAATEARRTFSECGVSSRITLSEGEALSALENLVERGPFDMVFIDANKSAYPQYLKWAERHLRIGGVIVADNVLLGGAVYQNQKPASMSQKQWHGMREFNEALADATRFLTVLLPTAEGLSVALRL